MFVSTCSRCLSRPITSTSVIAATVLNQQRRLFHGTTVPQATSIVLQYSRTLRSRSTPFPLLLQRTVSRTQSGSHRLLATKPAAVRGTSFWNRLATLVRYTRIPIIVVSVYSLGYQQGVIDCTKTPILLQEQILRSLLLSTGTKDIEKDVQIVSEKDIRWFSHQRHHQVACVGQKIIEAARAHVQEELASAMAEVNKKLPEDIDQESALQHYDKDATVQFWHQARLRLMGEEVESRPWQYIFIQSAAPNAFVTEILPRRFFITSAMLDVATTADELGMVLGHEVSHLILGHVSQTNQVETLLRTVEILLLSVDPTSGLLALAVIGALAALHKAFAAAHSRENEREADDLGVQLAARACFDTVKGTHVMRKMHEHSVSAATDAPEQDNSSGKLVRMMDTHPPTMERFEYLQKRSETENPAKYADQNCATVTSRIYGALWGSNKPSSDTADT
jgi:Zn-dependent protease with chaperone function